jgi:hypothetical protein
VGTRRRRIVATAGYASAFATNGNGDERYAGSSWVALYTIALFGNVILLIGLPHSFTPSRAAHPCSPGSGTPGSSSRS